MFKLPPAASGSGSKRKLPDLPAEEVLKRFRHNDDAEASNGGGSRTPSGEDAPGAAEEGEKTSTRTY